MPRRTAVTLAPMFTRITSTNVVRNVLVSLACIAAVASSALSLKSARMTEPGLTVDENRSASTAAAADGSDAESRYTYREDHDPNGIGKFYFGREIAHVMGFGPGGQGAQWLERSSREREERLALLVRSLRLKSGDVVADIGAGSGVVSLLMSEAVLPDGRVMAVDVQDEMLERLQARCDELQVTNVVPVKGTEKSPNLAPNSIDLAIMVDVYHEFEYPWEMMSQIAAALKPGGRVVFVEYRMEDPDVPIKLVHKMSQQQVRREIEQPEFGLKWTETIHLLPRQHIIVFTR